MPEMGSFGRMTFAELGSFRQITFIEIGSVSQNASDNGKHFKLSKIKRSKAKGQRIRS